MHAIETIDLKKIFQGSKPFLRPKKAVTAVDGITLRIEEGELFGLLGPNGAGKTTLLKLLSGITLPTDGSCYILGHNSATNGTVKSLIGVITGEERSFYWRLTGRDNLKFFATLYNLSPGETDTRISELANLLEIQDVLNKPFREYSTGMKQRLSIVRGLIHNPPVLLIDEPTKSLDPSASHRIRKFIKEQLVIKRNKTVLLTTHHIEEAEEICNRIAIMNKGKIKFQDTMNNIKKSGKNLDEIFSYHTGSH